MARIHVAVGVICQGDEVLIAQRVGDRFLTDLWEFPGGKVEAGETSYQGLQRELLEELNIKVTAATPLITVPFEYPDRSVLLDVWLVSAFDGSPRGNEGQPVQWTDKNKLRGIDFPEANRVIIDALLLPRKLAVSAQAKDMREYFERIEQLKTKGAEGLLIRSLPETEPDCLDQVLDKLSELQLAAIVHNNVIGLVGSIERDISALHLDSRMLLEIKERPPAYRYVGASCHSIEELQKAQQLGLSYALLSPVLPTASHPGQPQLGWQGFGDLVAQMQIPIYALGGVSHNDFSMAVGLGAQGVCCLRDYWTRK